MHEHANFVMVGLDCATHVIMSQQGNSWSSIPVTDTFLPVLSRT